MIVSKVEIKLENLEKEHFPDFLEARLKIMRPLGLRAGLGWNTAVERRIHRKRFEKGGMKKILIDGKCAGFIGKLKEKGVIELDQACIYRQFRSRSIGARV